MKSFWQVSGGVLLVIIVLALVVLALVAVHRFFEKYYQDRPEKVVRRQVSMLVLSLFGLFLTVLVLPVSETLRGQILGLMGILLSAAIALSSTTFLGNAMAGIMLRSVRSFRAGDFIRVRDHFGRVSGRELFHVEIQTEDRDLTTLPNLFLATNPVKVVRASGTMVSSEVSLGYDIPRGKVEELMVEAAMAAELVDPFVYVMSLNDFSITYRVYGLLPEVKQLLSARSRLNCCILDVLHKGGIEIVSPSFMNTRVVTDKTFIPSVEKPAEKAEPEAPPEEIVFDKAEEAENLEEQQSKLEALKKQLGQMEDKGKREILEKEIALMESRLERLKIKIDQEKTSHEDKKS